VIVVRLMGGLGNQLFQYALGTSLQHCGNQQVFYDRAALDRDDLRRYDLDVFELTPRFSTPEQAAHARGVDRKGLRRKLWRLIQLILPDYHRQVIKENGPGFDPRILALNRLAYLIGYWQDESYFKSISTC